MDKRNWIIVGLLVACTYFYASQPSADTKPRRPIINAIAKAIQWLPWVAPVIVPFLDQPPEPVMDPAPDYEYGKAPEYTDKAPDGFAVIDHGDNW